MNYDVNKKYLRIDKSLLITFLSCPRLFKDTLDGKVIVPEEWYITIGGDFHEGVENFWKKVTVVEGVLFIPPLQSKNAQLNKMFENFKNLVKKKWEYSEGNLEKFYPKFVEKKFEARIEVDGWQVELVGKIDMLDMDENGDYVIVEWKTGKPDVKHKIELDFYSLLLSKLGYKVTKGVVYYPKYDVLDVYELDDKGREEILKILKLIIFCFENDIFPHRYGCDCHTFIHLDKREEGKNVQ